SMAPAPGIPEDDLFERPAADRAVPAGREAEGDDRADGGFGRQAEERAELVLAAVQEGGEVAAEAEGAGGEEQVLDGRVEAGAPGAAGRGRGDRVGRAGDDERRRPAEGLGAVVG